MPQHLTDKEIVDMLCSEDEKSKRPALLFMEEQWKPFAYQVVVKHGNGEREQAEGIYDEAVSELILLIRNGKYIREKSRLSTFFYGIIQNKWRKYSRDIIAKQQKQQEASEKLPGSPQVSAEERLIEEERAKAVADAIAQLDKSCRRLILDFWFEGKSLREIAGKLEVSGSAVKKRHERCKEKLREKLRRFLE